MSPADKEKQLNEWLLGNISDEALAEQLSEVEVSQYKAILDTVDEWVPAGMDEAVFDAKTITQRPKKEAKVIKMPLKWSIGIAASIALLIGFFRLFNAEDKNSFYAAGENLEIVLPDESTRVVLSPGASLSYQNFDIHQRKVTLSGRAFFDVSEKGPFTVTFDQGELQVLGTQFELDNITNDVVAKCYSGKVELNIASNKVQLGKGEQAQHRRGDWSKEDIREPSPSWINGKTERFSSEELSKVLSILSLKYGVEFVHEGISVDRRFTGVVPINDLEKSCKVVFSALGIPYRIEKNTVTLLDE